MTPTHSLTIATGGTQYAEITDATQTGLDLSTDFTFTAKVKLTQHPAFATRVYTFLRKWGASGEQAYIWQYYRTSGGVYRMSVPNWSTTNAFGYHDVDVQLPLNEWVHVAITKDGTTGRAYLNGILLNSANNFQATIKNVGADFQIGSSAGDTAQTEFEVAAVRVYSRALSQSEINADARTENPTDPSIEGAWNLDNDYVDGSGNGNDLSPVGSPLFTTDIPPQPTGVTLTPQTNRVLGTHTDFPALVQPAAITGFGSLTLAEAQSLRFYTDNTRTTELAREVVSANEIHVKVPSLTSTTAVYAEYDGLLDNYAVTNPYGRNAVWSNYERVSHDGAASDVSGNNAGGTGSGITAGDTAGQIGDATAWTADNITLPNNDSALTPTGDTARGFSFWLKPNLTSSRKLLEYGNSGAAQLFRVTLQSDLRIRTQFYITYDPGVYSAANLIHDTWQLVHVMYDGGGNFRFYVNGAESTASTGGAINTTFGFYGEQLGDSSYTGDMDEARFYGANTVSADWASTEYNNQNDNGAFWGVVTGGVAHVLDLSETVMVRSAVSSRVARVLVEVVVLTATLSRQVSLVIGHTIVSLGSVTKTTVRALGEVLSVLSVMNRQTDRVLIEVVAISESLVRTLQFVLAESLRVLSELARLNSRSIGESLLLTGRLERRVVLLLNETVRFTGRIGRQLVRPLAETVRSADSLVRLLGRTFIERIPVVGRVGRIITQRLYELVSLTGTVRRNLQYRLTETVVLTTNFGRLLGRTLRESVGLVSRLWRSVATQVREALVLSDAVTALKNIVRLIGRFVVTSVYGLVKRVRRPTVKTKRYTLRNGSGRYQVKLNE